VDFCAGGGGVGNDDERVDFQVGELAVDVDSVQARDEVDENVVYALGDLLEKCGSDLIVGWILCEIDRDQEFLCLCIDIADVNTTLMSEINPVALLLEWLAFNFRTRFGSERQASTTDEIRVRSKMGNGTGRREHPRLLTQVLMKRKGKSAIISARSSKSVGWVRKLCSLRPPANHSRAVNKKYPTVREPHSE